MSRRTERLASVIRNILADAIQFRLSDPRIERMTSITRVEVSQDLSICRVYVSVMASGPRRELTLAALRHAGGHLRSIVAERVSIRQTPALVFHLDESLRKSLETLEQIDLAMAEYAPVEPADDMEADSADPASPRDQSSAITHEGIDEKDH